MAENNNPTFVLYVVVSPERQDDKSKWVRVGALWKARTGFSGKPEALLTLFPPFNNPAVGLAMMPYESTQQRTNAGQRR